jgi:hypothetical protein
MKRIALVSALACGLASQAVFAEQVVVIESRRPSPNLLLINPGDLFNGVFSLEYERALGRFFGLTAGFSAWTFNGPFSFGQPNYTVFGPEVGLRLHLIESAPAGLWLGPSISAGYVIARDGGAVARAWSWGLNAGVGYNFVLGRHFVFQLGAAGGFVDYGDRLVWQPHLKLGLGGVF